MNRQTVLLLLLLVALSAGATAKPASTSIDNLGAHIVGACAYTVPARQLHARSVMRGHSSRRFPPWAHTLKLASPAAWETSSSTT